MKHFLHTLILGIISLIFLFPNHLYATTHTVTTTADTGTSSLRNAIASASAGDRIEFASALGGSTITFASRIVISIDLELIAPLGGITLSGGNTTGIFEITSSSIVQMEGLTLSDGYASGSSGGAILLSGKLTLEDCTLDQNTADDGGAIAVQSGSLEMTDCTLSNNAATFYGGALYVDSSGDSVVITRSTLHSNSSIFYGGAIYSFLGNLHMNHSTISGNTAVTAGGIFMENDTLTLASCTLTGNHASLDGGGMFVDAARVVLFNSILSDNTAGTIGPDGYNLGGKLVSPVGYNFIGDNDDFGLTPATTDWAGSSLGGTVISASLSALTHNGGKTWTHMPSGLSPVVDQGTCSGTADQRGYPRMSGSTCDVGAVEFSSSLLPVELVTFEGESRDSHIDLIWQTQSEINFSHFQIEKSVDGFAFQPIGEVLGKGKPQKSQGYTFRDKQPLAGYNYYRLAQLDLSGQHTYSHTIQVWFEATNQLHIQVGPIPFQDQISIEPNQPLDEIVLIDLNGKKLSPGFFVQGKTYRLEGLHPLSRGVYFLTCRSGDQVKTIKVIKG